MIREYFRTKKLFNFIALFLILFLGACSSTYYGAMEKVGIHKRDILVDRVESARDSQSEAQEQFKTALEQFESVVKLQETDLKKAYDKTNKEYERSEEAAQKVSARVKKVESVAEALFEEWQDELEQYQNSDLQRASRRQLSDTRQRYKTMLRSMLNAEKSMAPVLRIFKDNVLFLKHNLNAQAIGSLRSEFSELQKEITQLISKMNEAIESSNTFIAELQ